MWAEESHWTGRSPFTNREQKNRPMMRVSFRQRRGRCVKKPPPGLRFHGEARAATRNAYRLAVHTSSESRLTHGAGLCYTARIGSQRADVLEKSCASDAGLSVLRPTKETIPMSLDVTLTATRSVEVHGSNITHNLNRMAAEAGIYEACWRPDEIGITKAAQLIEPLRTGLALLKADPARFQAFNASNGWGMYEHFVLWVEEYLAACEANPDADVSVSR
jgi:hypothetical protein